MPANRFADVFQVSGAVSVPAASTEGVLLTTPPLNEPYDGQPVLLLAYYGCTPGAGVTGITFQFRRGTGISGATVQGASGLVYTVVAGAPISFTVMAIDTPPVGAGMQYVLTGTATGGAAVSVTQTLCSMIAICL